MEVICVCVCVWSWTEDGSFQTDCAPLFRGWNEECFWAKCQNLVLCPKRKKVVCC